MLMQSELRGNEKLNEEQCLARALGERHGHIRGIGRKPNFNNNLFPNEHTKGSQASTSQSSDNPQVAVLNVSLVPSVRDMGIFAELEGNQTLTIIYFQMNIQNVPKLPHPNLQIIPKLLYYPNKFK